MGEAFLQGQGFSDVLGLSSLLCWGLGLALALLSPGLIGLAYESYTHTRTEHIATYVSRFIPYSLYVALLELGNSLAGASLVLVLLSGQSALDVDLTALEYWKVWGALAGLFVGLFVLRHLSFALWQYVFIPKDRAERLAQDYFLINCGRMLVLMLLLLCTLSPLPLKLEIWIALVALGGMQMLRLGLAVCRLWNTEGAGVYLFLYLCTHELLPWLYVALGLEYVTGLSFLQ